LHGRHATTNNGGSMEGQLQKWILRKTLRREVLYVLRGERGHRS
jgi:hypothetical protein